MSVAIPLKRKYLSAHRGRYRSNHNQQGNTKRKKIGYDAHVAMYGVPPRRVLVLLATGKTRMEAA